MSHTPTTAASAAVDRVDVTVTFRFRYDRRDAAALVALVASGGDFDEDLCRQIEAEITDALSEERLDKVAFVRVETVDEAGVATVVADL